MEKKLPKYFVIKKDSDNPLWKKYIDWLNKTYQTFWGGCYEYYGFDGSKRCGGTDAYNTIKYFENNPTLLSLEEWDEIVNPKTLKVGDVVDIHGLEYKIYFYKGDGFWAACVNNTNNSRIFTLLNLNKESFTKQILGYYSNNGAINNFPYCNSLEDLTKLVNALKNYKPEEKQNNNMEKITIPEDLFIEGQKAMSKDQLALFKANVDPWTRQTTKEFIIEYYKKEACSGWKERIEKAFPFVKEDDKSVTIKPNSHFTINGDLIISNRMNGQFKDKAFFLSDDYNWDIKRDSKGILCLIPTKK